MEAAGCSEVGRLEAGSTDTASRHLGILIARPQTAPNGDPGSRSRVTGAVLRDASMAPVGIQAVSCYIREASLAPWGRPSRQDAPADPMVIPIAVICSQSAECGKAARQHESIEAAAGAVADKLPSGSAESSAMLLGNAGRGSRTVVVYYSQGAGASYVI